MSKFEGILGFKKRGVKNEKADIAIKAEVAGPCSNIEQVHPKFENKAKWENEEREWWEKMLRLKKIGIEDIATGYAEQFKEFVEKESGGNKKKENEVLAKWHMLHDPVMASSTTHGYCGYGIDVKSFTAARDLWVKATNGQLSADEINRWTEIKEAAEKSIRNLTFGRFDVDKFVALRGKWVDAGVLTEEEVNQLPEIKEAAEKSIKNLTWDRFDPSEFVALRGKWVDAGVLTEEEVNQLPGIKETAGKKIWNLTWGHFNVNRFIDLRDQWVDAGVLTEEEVNQLPGIKDALDTSNKTINTIQK